MWQRLCVFAIACTLVLGVENHDYVTDEDEQVASLADSRMELYCHGSGFKGSVNEAAGKNSLLKLLGNSNVAREVLSKAKEPEEVSTVFMEDYGTSWIVSRAMAIIMAVVALVFCGLFCLFSLCRCCAYERPTKTHLKNYAALVIAVVLVGLLICTINTLTGYWNVHQGLFNVQCTSVRLFDTLLRGEPADSGSFRGLLPVLEEFKKAENTLEHGSQFLLGMESVLHMTHNINKSATLVQGTLQLLQDMMTENRWLKTAGGKDLFHECEFCSAFGEALGKSLTAFDASAAGKLAAARAESQSSEAEKEAVKSALRQSAEELVEIKTSVVSMTKEMMADGGKLKQLKDAENLLGALTLAIVLLVTLAAIALGLCAGVSVYRFTFHEMDPEKEDKGENPYNPNIDKYARTTWCCGYFYIFLALLFAGIIFLVATPLGSFCLLMDDLDSSTLRQVAPGLGLDLNDKKTASAPAILDHCFHKQEGDVDTYLLDIIMTTKEGRDISARENIQSSMRDALVSRFAKINEGADQPALPLAGSAEVKALAPFLAFSDYERMLVGATSKLRNEDAYADMAIPKAGLVEFMGSSIACDDFDLPANMNGGTAKVIKGMSSLSTKLKTMGSEEGSAAPCAAKVTCTAGGFTEHACKAGNRFLDIKAEARSSATFRCDLFASPKDSSSFCDPQNMRSEQGLDGNIWSDDCLDGDGALKRKQKTCSLSEFTTYVQGFDQRLQKLLQRLDDQIQNEQPAIGSAVGMLMQRHVLSRSDFVSNGVTCKFFASYYQELVNGGCYQGVVGLRSIAKSYVYCAILAMLLVLSMYAVWCRSKGNIENWKPDRTEYKALLQKQKDEEEAARRAKEPKSEEEQTTWILADPNDPRNRLAAAK